MKLAIKAVLFSFMCITVFCFIYNTMGDHHFHNEGGGKMTFIDYLFLATTVQAGVGFSDIFPYSELAKLLMIIQQFIMISGNVVILYIFTL